MSHPRRLSVEQIKKAKRSSAIQDSAPATINSSHVPRKDRAINLLDVARDMPLETRHALHARVLPSTQSKPPATVVAEQSSSNTETSFSYLQSIFCGWCCKSKATQPNSAPQNQTQAAPTSHKMK
jgi:hypothetical protein